MTEMNKNRWINAGIGLITGLAVVLFGFILTTASASDKEFKDDIKNKASYEYVDRQDAELKKLINSQKIELSNDIKDLKESIHRELDGMDSKLDILIDNSKK